MNIKLPLTTIKTVLDDIIACDLPDDMMIESFASLEQAGPADMAVVLQRGDAAVLGGIDAKLIQATMAGVVLCQNNPIPGKPCLVVKDALRAYWSIVVLAQKHWYPQLTQPAIGANSIVHATAVLDAGVLIGSNTFISPQVVIGAGSIVGNNVKIHPGVRILERTIIGDYTIIHANTVIGSDGFGYEVTQKGLRKIPQVGCVRIGSHVEIGASCMIDRASFHETIIGDGVKMDNGIHIAHNVKIGAGSAILAQTGIAGSTTIGMGCMIGGQVAIKDHITIGNHVKIVSKSAVMNNIADGQTVCGIPAIPFTQWKRISVCLAQLPDIVKLAKQVKQATVTPARVAGNWWQRMFSREEKNDTL
jgi:UDP-3-O-[3-hydroxymyristoyl] glucosamine N-acyltransferase